MSVCAFHYWPKAPDLDPVGARAIQPAMPETGTTLCLYPLVNQMIANGLPLKGQKPTSFAIEETSSPQISSSWFEGGRPAILCGCRYHLPAREQGQKRLNNRDKTVYLVEPFRRLSLSTTRCLPSPCLSLSLSLSRGGGWPAARMFHWKPGLDYQIREPG